MKEVPLNNLIYLIHDFLSYFIIPFPFFITGIGPRSSSVLSKPQFIEFQHMLRFFSYILYLFISSVCLYACTCTMFVPGAHRGRRHRLPGNLSSQMVVSCHIGGGN